MVSIATRCRQCSTTLGTVLKMALPCTMMSTFRESWLRERGSEGGGGAFVPYGGIIAGVRAILGARRGTTATDAVPSRESSVSGLTKRKRKPYRCARLKEVAAVSTEGGGQAADFRRQRGSERVMAEPRDGGNTRCGVTAVVPASPKRQEQGAIGPAGDGNVERSGIGGLLRSLPDPLQVRTIHGRGDNR